MTAKGTGQQERRNQVQAALLVGAAHAIPTLMPALFGWVFGILGVPTAWVLADNTDEQGGQSVQKGLIGAAAIALLSGRIDFYLFTLGFVLLGWIMARGINSGSDPVATGARAVLGLGAAWMLYWGVLATVTGSHPYGELLRQFDEGFAAAGQMYMESGQLDPDTQTRLIMVIDSLRELFPLVLPGLLACGLLLTVCMNLVFFSTITHRWRPETNPWPPYRDWVLPEPLIWLVIISGILVLVGSGPLKILAINGLMVGCTLYSFQGFAVLMHLFERWEVPRYARLFIYLILIIQSYGLVLIGILGMADIWLNLRPGKTEDPKHNP